MDNFERALTEVRPAFGADDEQFSGCKLNGIVSWDLNVDELGAVLQKLYGAKWDDVPADFCVRVADIVLGLLFERDVTGATGFTVQQIDILPLLDWLQNCARPQFADSFAWLILELRECDPARFCCGMDPGIRSCVFQPCTIFYIKKILKLFFGPPTGDRAAFAAAMSMAYHALTLKRLAASKSLNDLRAGEMATLLASGQDEKTAKKGRVCCSSARANERLCAARQCCYVQQKRSKQEAVEPDALRAVGRREAPC
jgi:hypothetical protein